MLLKNLTKRERYIGALTVSVVFVAVVYLFILEPISGRWTGLTENIVSKQATLDKDTKILSRKAMLESEYARFAKYLKSSKSEEEAVAQVMASIETISRNDDCLIVSMKPVGIQKAGSYKEILIDVTAEATMAQFSKFLYDIENPKDMVLTVRRFIITPKSGQAKVLKGTFLITKLFVG